MYMYMYMYPYLEGIAEKGANTVCSFLHHSIQLVFYPLVNSKIIIFSDAAAGQNRNYTVLTFLTMLCLHPLMFNQSCSISFFLLIFPKMSRVRDLVGN